MNTKRILPFIISPVASALDFMTTGVGLSRGFYETHPSASFLNGVLIFFLANLILYFVPVKLRFKILIACLAFLGFVNNLFVLLGFSTGLIM